MLIKVPDTFIATAMHRPIHRSILGSTGVEPIFENCISSYRSELAIEVVSSLSPIIAVQELLILQTLHFLFIAAIYGFELCKLGFRARLHWHIDFSEGVRR